MDKIALSIGIVTILVLGAIGYLAFGRGNNPAQSDSNIVSDTGIHWHANLSIKIKGQSVEIPADIGIGEAYASTPFYNPETGESDVHTHDTTGQIHWEIDQGPVTKDHVTVGSFFQVWGKTFNQNQILDKQNGPEGTVKMFVNGKENTDFENYVIHDNDQIEIRYE